MYLLRDENKFDFIKSIDNTSILTTEDLKDAIIFDDVAKAKILKDYIELENSCYELEIVEIDFKSINENEILNPNKNK